MNVKIGNFYSDEFFEELPTYDKFIGEKDIIIGENKKKSYVFMVRFETHPEGKFKLRLYEGKIPSKLVEKTKAIELMRKRKQHIVKVLENKNNSDMIIGEPFAPTKEEEISRLCILLQLEKSWAKTKKGYPRLEGSNIFIMNTRDTDLPPVNFVFSNELTAIFDPITEKDLHKDYHEGCTDCDAKSHKNGCSVVKKWWEANKHTQDEPENKVVFECNNKCICYKKNGPLCKNRISKLNRAKLDLIVFKTLNTGYGLAAGCDIPEGTIISEYTGRLEYLTSKNTSSKANNTYSFEMDHMYVNTETTSNRKKYMINALDRGNETRFANHSCEPNMMSVISFGGVKNQNFHKIFFAALRDIKYGEELTIRYHNSAEEDQMEFVSCTCGEINCLKRLPSMIGKHWKL